MNRFFRYKPFGILRFTLALLVMTQHFCGEIAPLYLKQAVFPWGIGNLAVLGFFMMSGFIICEAYHYNYQGRPVAYLQNRFMRIVPGYWAALAVSLAVHYALFHTNGHLTVPGNYQLNAEHFGIRNLIKNVFAVVPHVNLDTSDTSYTFFPYAWALQTEVTFYLTVFAVGWAYPVLKRFIQWPYEYWLSAAGFVGIIAAGMSQMGMMPDKLAFGGYFAFGGSLFYFLQGRKKALLVLVPAFLEMLWHFRDNSAKDFLEIAAYRPGQYLVMGLILLAFVMLAKTQIKNTKIDKWFGDLSYSLYLNHFVAVIIILNVTDNFSVLNLFLGACASVALAWLMHKLVEQPLVKLRSAVRHNTTVEAVSPSLTTEDADVV